MNLEQIMSSIGSHMLAQYAVFSAQYQHRGLRGGAREVVVKDFLSLYLPANVEVVSGEIFDTSGTHSPECDVLVVDRQRVPLMFDAEKRMIPAEGVYSVVEVKSNLDSGQLSDCLQKCDRIKNLQKLAFYPEGGAITHVTNAYGEELHCFPTLFSIFAYHGIDPKTLCAKIEAFCEDKPARQTLDSVICLDGWVICWWDQEKNIFDLTCSPGSRLVIMEAKENSLLIFYLLYYRWLAQATCRPIRMTDYIPSLTFGKVIVPGHEGDGHG